MHPPDCPSWEYSHQPDSPTVLKEEIKAILLGLRNQSINTLTAAADTRQVHLRIFHRLTPPECPYYAGHYRGEDFRCLKYNEVTVGGDPRVGTVPHLVSIYMQDVQKIVTQSVASLDQGMARPNAQVPLTQKIVFAVAAVSRIFEFFLRIHPYVNGNGHAARFCIWAILGRYNLWPRKWPIHPRPDDPPYTELIVQYRNGNPVPLEKQIFQSLLS
jgi:hypothetical protein